LEVKRNFLGIRQRTIKELQGCYNVLETYINKEYNRIKGIGNATSAIGTATSFSFVKALGNPIKSFGELIIV